jgi:hypothetical protein
MSEQEEQMASETHNVWSSWMKYMFSKGETNPDGTWTMPHWAVNRWSRQLSTPYTELDEQEKQSDRDVIIEHYHSVLALKVRAQSAEARVEELEAKAQVCMDLHEALNVKFGDDPYARIMSLQKAEARVKELEEKLTLAERCIRTQESWAGYCALELMPKLDKDLRK